MSLPHSSFPFLPPPPLPSPDNDGSVSFDEFARYVAALSLTDDNETQQEETEEQLLRAS